MTSTTQEGLHHFGEAIDRFNIHVTGTEIRFYSDPSLAPSTVSVAVEPPDAFSVLKQDFGGDSSLLITDRVRSGEGVKSSKRSVTVALGAMSTAPNIMAHTTEGSIRIFGSLGKVLELDLVTLGTTGSGGYEFGDVLAHYVDIEVPEGATPKTVMRNLSTPNFTQTQYSPF